MTVAAATLSALTSAAAVMGTAIRVGFTNFASKLYFRSRSNLDYVWTGTQVSVTTLPASLAMLVM